MSLSSIKVNNSSVVEVDEIPTSGNDNLVESNGVAKYAGVRLEGVQEYNVWSFRSYIFEEGKSYYIKLVSGDGNNSKMGIGNTTQTEERMKTGYYVEIVAPATSHGYFYVGHGNHKVMPVIIILEKDVATSNDIIQIQQNKDNIQDLRNDLDYHISQNQIIDTKNPLFHNSLDAYEYYNAALKGCYIYGAKEGYTYSLYAILRNFSNQYLANEYQIYLRVINEEDPSEKIKLYIELKNNTNWDIYDGKIIHITAYYNNIKGVEDNKNYEVAPSKVEFWIDYEKLEIDSHKYESYVNNICLPINKQYIFTDGIKTLTSYILHEHAFSFPIRLLTGRKYFVKLLSELYGATFATTENDVIGLIPNEWIDYTCANSKITPFLYITNYTTSEIDPPVIQIVEQDSNDSIQIMRQKGLEKKTNVIYVSRDGTSRNGKTISFSGLTAISDAIDSITDASENNRYIIHFEGTFHFTDPLTVPMFGGNEYSVIYMKDNIDIEGDGPDNSVIFMDFPANATFHTGKAYNDYQPIYFHSVGGQTTLRDCKIVARNCRYVIHIERGTSINRTVAVRNCIIESLGAWDYGSNLNCFGTGMSQGDTWNIEDCEIIDNGNGGFVMHTPLLISKQPSYVNFKNCRFICKIGLHNYPYENKTYINFTSCKMMNQNDGTYPKLTYTYYTNYPNDPNRKTGDHTNIITRGADIKAAYDTTRLEYSGEVLCIKAASTNSQVRFVPTSSAFDIIVGDSSIDAKTKTIYRYDTQYGFVWRDSGSVFKGYAFGTTDIDENSVLNRGLGQLLGDCSQQNKVLGIVINNTTYNVSFTEDYSSKNNAYILNVINNVLGNVGTASLFNASSLYYPEINGLCYVKCVDERSISKNMGVVFTTGGMRRAKNSDGFVDGVCIEDVSPNQEGRVITCGYFIQTQDYSLSPVEDSFNFGISAQTDGLLQKDATPTLFRWRKYFFEIL